VRKKTIQEPTCRALVFFRGVYFIFHSNVRVIFTFQKEIMNVLTASFIWETFFQKVIQQGYDVNPLITERFGTSTSHRIPFLFQNTHHQNQFQEGKQYRQFERVSVE